VTKIAFTKFAQCLKPLLARFGDPLGNATVLDKFLDQSWQLVIHVSMSAFELYMLSNETWWDDTRTIWQPCPPTYRPKLVMRIYYLLQLAIWIYTAFSHRFLEKPRKDYVVMFSHHVFTIFLVASSFLSNSMVIGMVILFIHDISDIPVDLVKMLNLMRLQDKQGFFLSEIVFVGNMVCWAVFRLYLFPVKIGSALVQGHEICTFIPEHQGKFWIEPPAIPQLFSGSIVLSLLWCLHIYWFLLFVRILKKALGFGAQKSNWHEAGAQEYEGSSADDEQSHKQD